MVDADQDWISQIETLLALIRGLGLALAAILLGASVFTIASVVRLTSFLYREEIGVMRLVGATEFYIRGPFYFEGILQGLIGGLIAAGALGASHLVLAPRVASSLVAGSLAATFLSPAGSSRWSSSVALPAGPAPLSRSPRESLERSRRLTFLRGTLRPAAHRRDRPAKKNPAELQIRGVSLFDYRRGRPRPCNIRLTAGSPRSRRAGSARDRPRCRSRRSARRRPGSRPRCGCRRSGDASPGTPWPPRRGAGPGPG